MIMQMPKTKTQNTGGNKKNPNMVFFGAVMDLSWRMVFVVLVPIIVGNKIDNSFNIKPLFTILGLVIAVAGSAAVIRSAVKKADRAMAASDKQEKHD